MRGRNLGPLVPPPLPRRLTKTTHRFRCAVKSRASSAGAIPARQLSFQPVVIGAAMEETKSSEPSTRRVA